MNCLVLLSDIDECAFPAKLDMRDQGLLVHDGQASICIDEPNMQKMSDQSNNLRFII